MRRDTSIAVLGSAQAVQRGMLWGQAVADSIWAARQSDGFTPAMAPFMGSATLGFWRPTPPGNLSGSGPQFATMTPWVLTRPSQFRPAPPPALASAEYAADYNETRMWGEQQDLCDNRTTPMWRGSGAATAPCTGTASQLSSPRHVIGPWSRTPIFSRCCISRWRIPRLPPGMRSIGTSSGVR